MSEAAPDEGGFFERNRAGIIFTLLFALLVGGSYPLLQSTAFRDACLTPYCSVLAELCGGVLRLLGEGVEVSGGYIRSAKANLVVVHECTGVFAMTLLASALIAFPARLRDKLIGAAVLLPLLWAVNLFRIVTLYYVAVFAPQHLELAHVYVWQTLIIFFAVVCWVVWVERIALRDAT